LFGWSLVFSAMFWTMALLNDRLISLEMSLKSVISTIAAVIAMVVIVGLCHWRSQGPPRLGWRYL
jgi:hypothetical protein